MRIILLLCATMFAFAGNSIFTRLALSTSDIDALSFAVIRMLSAGLLVLMIIPSDKSEQWQPTGSRGLFLVAYALPFSYAYTFLSASLGALVLFGTVQITMITYAIIFRGERLNLSQCFGFGLAITGSLMLFAPSVRPPDSYLPVLIMMFAGIAWAGFSLANPKTPLNLTGLRQVFKQAVILSIIFYCIGIPFFSPGLDIDGIVYAVLCGALTTGMGYCLWCIVLNQISSITAAVAQISVPVISMLLGVSLLGENVSRLELSSASLVLLGIAIYILAKYLSALTVDADEPMSSQK